MKKYYYEVIHAYDIKDHHGEDYLEERFIGIFSTQEKAQKVIDNYKKLAGFKMYSNNFKLYKTEPGQDLGFHKGYFTSRGIDLPYWFSNEGVMDREYGKGNWSKRNPEYTQLRKYRDM